MSRSRFSSLFLRSALASQVSISVTSLACSAFGESSLPSDSGIGLIDDHLSSSLPWIDDLHNTVSLMYLGRGAYCPGMRDNSVQIHPDATVENPIICYSGISEIQRAFRSRAALSRDDTTALLECVDVQASDDAIVNGGRYNYKGSHCPPKIEVTYRLQKTYGSHFSLNTMLKVTVQCQQPECHKIMFQLPERAKTGVLATSSLSKNIMGGFNIVNSGVTYLLAKEMCQKWIGKMSSLADPTQPDDTRDFSYIAEVIKIEECWNEVKLVQPFHLSRRINGLLMGSVTYLLFDFIA